MVQGGPEGRAASLPHRAFALDRTRPQQRGRRAPWLGNRRTRRGTRGGRGRKGEQNKEEKQQHTDIREATVSAFFHFLSLISAIVRRRRTVRTPAVFSLLYLHHRSARPLRGEEENKYRGIEKRSERLMTSPFSPWRQGCAAAPHPR